MPRLFVNASPSDHTHAEHAQHTQAQSLQAPHSHAPAHIASQGSNRTPQDLGVTLCGKRGNAEQQRAKGKSFLRLVTLGKPVILEFDSEGDVGTVVDTLGPLLSVPHPKPAQGGGPDSQAELKRSLLAEDR